MKGYIDVSEIPGYHREVKYPYSEWAAIPQGRALEITSLADGRKPANMASAISIMSKAKGLGLVVVRRGDRVWIARPKAEPAP